LDESIGMAFTGPVSPGALVLILFIGLAVGFLGGLFGKGGSAIGTPLLAAVGVSAIAAVASPLPATIPGTLLAAREYARHDLVDRRIVRWSLAIGLPATVVGAYITRFTGGGPLVVATEVLLVVLGLRFLLAPGDPSEVVDPRPHETLWLCGVALTVGFLSGLLANSGGFLLAPLFVAVLRRPLKVAFATSLVVACALAVPGTIVHVALGHVDWAVTGMFALGSIPGAATGARVALRTHSAHLERVYGATLAILGVIFLATAF
jgi:uncharacterized membrane protein YfcA